MTQRDENGRADARFAPGIAQKIFDAKLAAELNGRVYERIGGLPERFVGYPIIGQALPHGEIVLAVTGGRSQSLTNDNLMLLQSIYDTYMVTECVHGAAKGIDQEFDWWAACRLIPRTPFEANWSHGKAGGPMRNAAMIEYVRSKGRGVLVVFKGGAGSTDCFRRGVKAGLMVIDAREDLR